MMKPTDKNFTDWCEAIKLSNRFIGMSYTYLEERVVGNFAIKQRVATEKDCLLEKDRARFNFNFRPVFDLKPGTYTYLMRDDEAIMSDTPTEIFTNIDFIMRAHGDVLIAGLGLGIMLQILTTISTVDSVTVIEKEQDVIDLVWDQLNLPSKFKVVKDDIFTHMPEKKYDVIYFDIWGDIDQDALNEIEFLENRYQRILKETDKSWIGSWKQEA